jgi:outer membrane protein TolC
MTYTKIILLGIILVTAAAPLRAQRQALTIEESIAMALAHSRSLYASEKRADYADAKAGEAAAALYPTVKLQGMYQRLSDVPAFQISIPGREISFPVVLNNYNLKATVQQPLFTGWKLQGIADNAEYTAQAAACDLAKDEQELIYAVRSAYWNVYRTQELKRLSDENVRLVQLHLSDIENFEQQGMATRNDVLKVNIQLSNAKILQIDATNAVRIAMLVLNSTLGLPLTSEITLTSTLVPSEENIPELDRLLSSASQTRPDLQGSQFRLQAAQAGITAARGGWWPQIFLTGSYYYARPNQRIFPALDQFRDTWDVGVSFQLDIWNSLTTVYQTTQAQALYEQTRASFDGLKDGMTLEVTQAYLASRQMKEKVTLSQLIVEQAEENYRITYEKFKSGLTTNSELLEAETATLQAKIQLTTARVEDELALARLQKAIGGLHP